MNGAKSPYQKAMYWLCWVVLAGLIIFGLYKLF